MDIEKNAAEKNGVNRLVLVKVDKKILVYFWYQTNKHVYDDLYRLKFDLLQGKFMVGENNERNIFVRVFTPVVETQEEAEHVLNDFVQEVSFELSNVLQNMTHY